MQEFITEKAARLKELRITIFGDCRSSISNAAIELGTNYSTYYNWESGRVPVPKWVFNSLDNIAYKRANQTKRG